MVADAGINAGYFFSEVIGDFPEEEARRFAGHALDEAGISDELTDDDWRKVYEVKSLSWIALVGETCQHKACSPYS